MRYSIGSSIVVIFFDRVFKIFKIEYIEVDFPDPVGPVERIMPYDFAYAWLTLSRSLLLIPRSVRVICLLCEDKSRSTAFSPSAIGIIDKRKSRYPSSISN